LLFPRGVVLGVCRICRREESDMKLMSRRIAADAAAANAALRKRANWS
jgi:hypothetical protein